MTMAIAAAVCCAFVSKHDPDPTCGDTPQYYLVGYNTYIYAGDLGYDYDCDWNASVTCTYYKPDPAGHPDTYATCHLGNITLFNGAAKAK